MSWQTGDILGPTNLNSKGGVVGISVTDSAYGAVADGRTDNTAAFQAAVNAAALTNGVVLVPASTGSYVIASPVTLGPQVTIQGSASEVPTIVYTGSAASALFSFTGTSESEFAAIRFANLRLISATPNTGIGVRLRNFSHCYFDAVRLSNWSDAIWADWGQALYLDRCNLSSNSFALKVGGVGPAGGLRSGNTFDFFDWLHVRNTGFAQNQVDIEDKGSHYAHGQRSVMGCTFYESSPSPVTGKQFFCHHSGVKAVNYLANTWESSRSRACITHDVVDADGQSQGTVVGGMIAGNEMLLNGGSGTTGVWLRAAESINCIGNAFESILGSGVAYDFASSTSNLIAQSKYSGLGASFSGSTNSNVILDTQQLFNVLPGSLLVNIIGATKANRVSTNTYGFQSGQTGSGASTSYAFVVDTADPTNPYVSINTTANLARLTVDGTGLFASAVRSFSGTSLTPSFAFSSEQSLGWYRSTSSTMAPSYGIVDLRGASASLRTTNSAGSSSALTNGEICLVAVSNTSAQIAWRSGNTTYLFNAVAASP